MSICDKIQNIGDTLEDNLNDRGVSCTFGTGTGEQTIYDMAELITKQNLMGIGDANIQIIPNRSYVTSGETIDVTVRLLNGVGNPLINKIITISDGTNTYNGTTDTNGLFTLFNQTITTTTTYTVTYGTETATTNVYLCQFVDYGTTSNYTNWDIVSSDMQMTRQDTYTELKRTTNASSFGYIIKDLGVTDGITIEFDLKQATIPSANEQYLSFRDIQGNTKLGISRNYQSLNDGEWHHYKLVVNGLTITPVIDGVQKSNLTLSGSWSRLQLEARNNAVQHFKNFVIY